MNTHLLLSPTLSSIRMEEREKTLVNCSFRFLNSMPVLPNPLLHPMEEREKSRSLMQA